MGTISAPRTSLAEFANFNRRRDADVVGSIGAVSQEHELQNVAAGQISATSTDAVNGTQLFPIASQWKK
jgi:hypothetical protein